MGKKSFLHSRLTKSLLFLIVLACGVILTSFIAFLTSNGLANREGRIIENIQKKDYLETDAIVEELVNPILSDYLDYYLIYKNEENVKAGKTLDLTELKEESSPYSYQAREADRSYEDFLIEKELEEFYHIKDRIEEDKDSLAFSLIQGDKTYGDIHIKEDDYPLRLVIDMKKEYISLYPQAETGHNHRIRLIRNNLERYLEIEGLEFDRLELDFSDEYLRDYIRAWEMTRSDYLILVWTLIGLFLLAFFAFILLATLAGRKSFIDKEVSINAGDKIYTEFKLIILLAALLVSIQLALSGFTYYLMVGALSLVSLSIAIWIVLSLIKDLKAGRFIKNSLIYKLFKYFWSFIAISPANSQRVLIGSIITGLGLFIVLGFANTNSGPGFLFRLAISLVLARIYYDYGNIRQAVASIKEGELEAINIESKILKGLSSDISSISQVIEKIVEKEMRSERLKNELITNMGHDIRTPITSIIAYTDLIKNEEDLEKIKEYNQVVYDKSLRLKKLTEDLFEASKISSGNISVNLEKLDIVSLVNQSIGETSTKIEEKGLDFRFDNHQPIFVKGDGELLYRVIDNIISNILKYSLDNSRVYLEITDDGEYAYLEFKNISLYELNISPEELYERFTRGDKSRTTKGSGLGLSIAKSLCQAQGGDFIVEIDGDLFKSIVKIKLA